MGLGRLFERKQVQIRESLEETELLSLVIYVFGGNHRIGIYAKTDSKFGDEMFYDYGYTKDIIGEARVWAHDDDQQDQGNYRK